VNRYNTSSGGCAECSQGSYQDKADECDPKNCSKKKCYSGANCKNLGATLRTIGKEIFISGGKRCSKSQGCTAATSPTVGGPCNGTFPPANGQSVQLTC
jgi:hypothetical protein